MLWGLSAVQGSGGTSSALLPTTSPLVHLQGAGVCHSQVLISTTSFPETTFHQALDAKMQASSRPQVLDTRSAVQQSCKWLQLRPCCCVHYLTAIDTCLRCNASASRLSEPSIAWWAVGCSCHQFNRWPIECVAGISRRAAPPPRQLLRGQQRPGSRGAPAGYAGSQGGWLRRLPAAQQAVPTGGSVTRSLISIQRYPLFCYCIAVYDRCLLGLVNSQGAVRSCCVCTYRTGQRQPAAAAQPAARLHGRPLPGAPQPQRLGGAGGSLQRQPAEAPPPAAAQPARHL